MADLREKGAVEPAPSGLGYYSHLFVTPKVTGGWRPVIDLSHLNRSVFVSRFHIETAASILQSLRPGDWMVFLDLQDAYLQVPVHPSSWHYLRFCVGDSVLQFRALCFGLSTAPQVFTRVKSPVSAIMHRYGFRILRYLDDWLVLGSLFQDIVRLRDFLLWLCQELVVWVNLSKGSLDPSQTLDYLGMRLQARPLKVFPTPKRVQKLSFQLLEFVSCPQQPLTLWRQLLGVMSSMSSIVPGSRLRMRSLQMRLNTTGRLFPDSTSVSWDDSCLDLRWWSEESHLSVGLPLDLLQPDLALCTDASDSGWGAFLQDDHLSCLWSRSCLTFSINHQELLAVFYGVQGFLPALHCRSVSLFVDNTTTLSYLRKQGDSLRDSELCSPVDPPPLRTPPDLTDSTIHSRQAQCVSGFSESSLPGTRLGMDLVSSGLPGASLSMACDHQPLLNLNECSSSGVRRSNGGSSVSGHRRHDAVVGWHAGVCLPSLRPSASCAVEGSAVQGSGAHPCGSVLASAPLVSRPSGTSGGCPSVPSTAEGCTQTAALPSLSPEPPRASADCVSYIERSTRAFGFTLVVARQLARCRRRSTRVNYQAKWSVFRAWCRRHGHSMSRPTILKIASLLLYFCRSLSLSYSSIASYRSMLSCVFRFVLPDLSSQFVLRDLLHSFRLERPLSSSRVPLWDLSRVLSFLRGAPLSPSLPTLLGIFLIRCSSWFPWLQRVGWGSFRIFRLWPLSLEPTSFCLSFQSFGLRQSPNLVLSLVLSAFVLSRTLLVTFQRNSCVQSVLCVFTFLGLLFLLDHGLFFFSLLVLLLALCLRTPLVFFLRDVIAEAYSSSGLSLPSSVPSSSLLPRPLLSVLMGSGVSRLRGRFIGMLLFLLFWRPLLGLPPLSLLCSISLMYSSLPLRVLVWVRWWLRVLLFNVVFGVF